MQSIEKDSNINQTLSQLQRIFYTHLFLCDLHLFNTKDKMMNMLRRESGKNWNSDFILELSRNYKIIWVQGSDDLTDSKTYQKSMNDSLTEILLKD